MRQTPVILAVLVTLVIAASSGAAETDAIRRGPVSASTQPVSVTGATSGFGASRVGLALIGIVGLILALKWGGEKFFGGSLGTRSSRAVQVLSRNPVGPKQALLLVQVGRRVLIVGDSAGSMSRLTEITDPDEVAELVGQVRREKNDATTRTFGPLFKSAEKDFDLADDINGRQEAVVTVDESPVNNDPLEMRDELAGLSSRIRSLSRQLGKGAA